MLRSTQLLAVVTLASANAGYRQHVLQANLAMAGGPRQPVPYTQVCQLNLLTYILVKCKVFDTVIILRSLACSVSPKVLQSVLELPSRDIQVAQSKPLEALSMPSSGAQAQDAAMGYGSPKTSADRVTGLSWPFNSEPGNLPYTTLENGKTDKQDEFMVSCIPALLYFISTTSSINAVASREPAAVCTSNSK